MKTFGNRLKRVDMGNKTECYRADKNKKTMEKEKKPYERKEDFSKFKKEKLINIILLYRKYADLMFDVGFNFGSKAVYKVSKKHSIDSLDRGYNSISNKSIINACDERIEEVEKDISKFMKEIDKLIEGLK